MEINTDEIAQKCIDAINEKTEEISVRYSAPIKIGNPAKYDTLIVGQEGSTAEEYALKYRRCFEAIPHPVTGVGPEIVEDRENGIVYDTTFTSVNLYIAKDIQHTLFGCQCTCSDFC